MADDLRKGPSRPAGRKFQSPNIIRQHRDLWQITSRPSLDSHGEQPCWKPWRGPRSQGGSAPSVYGPLLGSLPNKVCLQADPTGCSQGRQSAGCHACPGLVLTRLFTFLEKQCWPQLRCQQPLHSRWTGKLTAEQRRGASAAPEVLFGAFLNLRPQDRSGNSNRIDRLKISLS